MKESGRRSKSVYVILINEDSVGLLI